MAKDVEPVNVRVEGGRPLNGTVRVNTSKNAAVALLVAALLNRGRTTLKRVPKIEEVNRFLEMLTSLGVRTEWQGNNLIIQPPDKLPIEQLDKVAASRTRTMLLFLGAFIHQAREFALPHPGGCKLGERTVRPHLFALEKFGVRVKVRHTHYEVRAARLRPAEVVLYETGDTVTENALMAAALIPGTSVIKFASANYMVQELCFFLQTLGVQIEGVGTSTLTVTGMSEVNRDVEYELAEDPIEAMLFIAIAATTSSRLTIAGAPIDFVQLELLKLEKMGFKYKLTNARLAANGRTKLVDITTAPSKLKALEEKIHPLPYPGINIDNLPFFVPIATQANGQTLIHDWVYENRAIYYMELNKLGAEIILADPHRVLVKGPTALRGTEIICPPALRPAAIILIAMLAAEGVSILRNTYTLNRGYEDLAGRLRTLGAKIDII